MNDWLNKKELLLTLAFVAGSTAFALIFVSVFAPLVVDILIRST